MFIHLNVAAHKCYIPNLISPIYCFNIISFAFTDGKPLIRLREFALKVVGESESHWRVVFKYWSNHLLEWYWFLGICHFVSFLHMHDQVRDCWLKFVLWASRHIFYVGSLQLHIFFLHIQYNKRALQSPPLPFVLFFVLCVCVCVCLWVCGLFCSNFLVHHKHV